LTEITPESAFLELGCPFLPPVLDASDDLITELPLLPLGFAQWLVVPVLDAACAQAPSREDFVALY